MMLNIARYKRRSLAAKKTSKPHYRNFGVVPFNSFGAPKTYCSKTVGGILKLSDKFFTTLLFPRLVTKIVNGRLYLERKIR